MRYFAHTLEGSPPADWQALREHLEEVGDLAGEFAEAFDAAEWARTAGRWHDLGKYSQAFQDYLLHNATPDVHRADSATRTDHSTAGAQHAAATVDTLGHLLAYVIAGHHSGLHDAISTQADLEGRLTKDIEPWDAAPEDLKKPPRLEDMPRILQDCFELGIFDRKRGAFGIAFFTRMLFSCLVDADFLNTEAFMDPAKAAQRPQWPKGVLHRIEKALDAHIAGFGEPTSDVDRQRARVRRDCLDAVTEPPGLFSLTVPTGGGKTLSSLAFALRHARRHGLRRVIYVIPFTSIIEQNAAVFRQVTQPLRDAGLPDPVLEHHSRVDVGRETVTSRLASENWDAPLVVTTALQFYESLFANRTSRCRKLHRLARSVIILDEAQTLPVDLLAPCLQALDALTRDYGASVVLCTATQPAIDKRDGFDIGLEGVREIVTAPRELYRGLERVRVENLGAVSDADLAARLRREERVLCIVNTRGHARVLYEALAETDGSYHLSALMCPEHRSARLAEIRRRLDAGDTCRVISTQLIEAGVDVDFPTVYRSLAGLDAIAQAAGRCNRNGKLAGKGTTYVFESEHAASERFLKDTANVGRQLLALYPDDPLALDAIERYFKLYYWDQEDRLDAKKILSEFKLGRGSELPFLFGFATAAENFRLIDSIGEPVIVPWGGRGVRLCEELRASPMPDRKLLRGLQRYTVDAHRRSWDAAVAAGNIELVHTRYPVLVSPDLHYSETLGLSLDEDVSTLLNI